MSTNGDSIMASEAVLVPPSPGVLNGFFDGGSAQTATTVPNLPIRSPTTPTKTKEPVKPNDRTGAGVKKNSPKSKAAIQKLVDALTASAATGEQAAEQPFRFMDLPGGKYHFLKLSQVLTIGRDPQPRLPPHSRQSQAGSARPSSSLCLPSLSHSHGPRAHAPLRCR
jgi:hypothetical protein